MSSTYTSHDKPRGQGLLTARGTRLRAALASGLRLLVLVLVGFLVVLYSLQDRMIFPGAATQGTPEATVHPAAGAELVTLATPRADKVTALFGRSAQPDGSPLADPMSRPALLYFYGNAMCLAYAEPEFERFRRLGLNVMIPDYLGYGLSTGKPSEIGCRRDGRGRAWSICGREGFPASTDHRRGVVAGRRRRHRPASRQPFGGLIAFSTFTSTHDMARNLVPVPLPAVLPRTSVRQPEKDPVHHLPDPAGTRPPR